MNLKEILEAWIIAHNPTQEQIELANLRGEICMSCPSRKHIIVDICTECGCPISKKVFTNNYNPCPLKKWKDVDGDKYDDKENKTLI